MKNLKVVEAEEVRPKRKRVKTKVRPYGKKLNNYRPRRSQLKSVETVEGEPIEYKVERLVSNKEPIKDGAPEIFTERKEGVLSAYNVRTDRWEIATEAMDSVAKSYQAKREEKGKVIPLKEDVGDESVQGTKTEDK